MEDKLVEKINRIVSNHGLIVYEIRFTKFDNNDIFEVVVDNEESNITLDKVEEVTRPISKVLNDYEDIMPENYYLQVISPGTKRKIFTQKHYDISIGKVISIKYFDENKTKKIEGTLISSNPITLNSNKKEIVIQLEKIKEGKWIE